MLDSAFLYQNLTIDIQRKIALFRVHGILTGAPQKFNL